MKALPRSWFGEGGSLECAEGRPQSYLHWATTQGEQKKSKLQRLWSSKENQAYTGSIQDLSRILIPSLIVLFLNTLIIECGVCSGCGIRVLIVVACCNVGYLYTRVCVCDCFDSKCVCVCCCLQKRVCVLNIVRKFLTLWGSGRRSRETEHYKLHCVLPMCVCWLLPPIDTLCIENN